MSNTTPDQPPLRWVNLDPDPPLADYFAAMGLADREASARLGDCMLLSWYDRDQDSSLPSIPASATWTAPRPAMWTMASTMAPP
ncbi:MAG: AF1514 family protein [Chromatiaceae bacterium]|nr:AF1514 family protein [Chromatiaceae bacterium]MBP8282441.1 AF1514 family protein [Chromatiaceae bacterium]MBP8289089.1 AF1514 family protein [Chromatiaceae bacterium]MBP9603187.1 AF1514 family protein [Chromatiaceae bacterium]